MNTHFIDFEAWFSATINAKKLGTFLYARHPQFFIWGLGYARNDEPARWITNHDEILYTLTTIDLRKDCIVGHNLKFDGSVLLSVIADEIVDYDAVLAELRRNQTFFRDTLSMCNAFLPIGQKRNLDAAAKFLGHKGKQHTHALTNIKGKQTLTDHELNLLGDYCLGDIDATRHLYNTLWPAVPRSEAILMHMTTRMGVASQLCLDTKLLEQEIEEQTTKRANNISLSGHNIDQLVSNQKFERLLADLVGLDNVPRKLNKNDELIPAFSKTDPDWVKFKTDHPELQPLLQAREDAKSNIMITRPERYLELSRQWPYTLPMAYSYYGAHTGRWSGSDGLNVQNMPALRKSNLRRCVLAPYNHVLHVCDLAQIELRVQLWFSGQLDSLNDLANGVDIYSISAAQDFNKSPQAITKVERAMGKAKELGLQFRMGATKYRAYLAGGPLGLDPIFVTERDAQRTVANYRHTHPATVRMWEKLDEHIRVLTDPNADRDPVQLGPVKLRYMAVELPNGMLMDYSGLHYTPDGWIFGTSKKPHFFHGGIFLQNIVQALARIVLSDAALAIDNELPHCTVAGWTHDETITIGPADTAKTDFEHIFSIHQRRPSWAQDLPIDAEGGYGERYDVK